MNRPPVFTALNALADPIRARLLLVLERHELTVGEMRRALQLPQSTVSRHLRALAQGGWVVSREDGTSNRYRMSVREKEGAVRRLWQSVRDDMLAMSSAQRDAERVRGVLADRHTSTRRFFASGVARWERVRAELFGARTELFALAGALCDTWTVGDLGCGTGQLALAMAPFVQRVIAVDESPVMLRAARARLAGLTNVEVRSGTLEALPVERHTLDVAVLSLVLHYLADPARALGNVRAALKPGGRLIVVDMLPHDRADMAEAMGHVWRGFAADQLAGWAREAGFARCRCGNLPPDPRAKGPNLFAAALFT